MSIAAYQKDGIADRLEGVASTFHRSGDELREKEEWLALVIDRGAGEMKLARIEFDQKIRKVILDVVFIVGSALVAFAGLIVFFLGFAAALALVLPVWAALLIVGAASLMAAAVLARAGVVVLSLKALASNRTRSSLQ